MGAFHHPLAVIADTNTLATLPAAELRAGLQEAVKAGVIYDSKLFRYMEQNADAILAGDPAALTRVVTASVRVKAEVVRKDERESGLRMILNFGHTLGHAIEAATAYKKLLHGQAVGLGFDCGDVCVAASWDGDGEGSGQDHRADPALRTAAAICSEGREAGRADWKR